MLVSADLSTVDVTDTINSFSSVQRYEIQLLPPLRERNAHLFDVTVKMSTLVMARLFHIAFSNNI